jgi:hypothetical protein
MASFLGPEHNWNVIHQEIKKDPYMWNLFTKHDEYKSTKYDKYNRLSYKASNQKNILKPLVSEYLIKKGFTIEYNDNKKFAIFLSHDIDDINISSYHLLRSIVPYPFHRDHLGFIKFVKSYLKKEKPYINFRKIIEIEKKFNASSTFFFLATEKDIFGKKYHLDELHDEI